MSKPSVGLVTFLAGPGHFIVTCSTDDVVVDATHWPFCPNGRNAKSSIIGKWVSVSEDDPSKSSGRLFIGSADTPYPTTCIGDIPHVLVTCSFWNHFDGIAFWQCNDRPNYIGCVRDVYSVMKDADLSQCTSFWIIRKYLPAHGYMWIISCNQNPNNCTTARVDIAFNRMKRSRILSQDLEDTQRFRFPHRKRLGKRRIRSQRDVLVPVSSDDSSPKAFFTSAKTVETNVKPLSRNHGPGMYTTDEGESDTESSVTSSTTAITSSLRAITSSLSDESTIGLLGKFSTSRPNNSLFRRDSTETVNKCSGRTPNKIPSFKTLLECCITTPEPKEDSLNAMLRRTDENLSDSVFDVDHRSSERTNKNDGLLSDEFEARFKEQVLKIDERINKAQGLRRANAPGKVADSGVELSSIYATSNPTSGSASTNSSASIDNIIRVGEDASYQSAAREDEKRQLNDLLRRMACLENENKHMKNLIVKAGIDKNGSKMDSDTRSITMEHLSDEAGRLRTRVDSIVTELSQLIGYIQLMNTSTDDF